MSRIGTRDAIIADMRDRLAAALERAERAEQDCDRNAADVMRLQGELSEARAMAARLRKSCVVALEWMGRGPTVPSAQSLAAAVAGIEAALSASSDAAGWLREHDAKVREECAKVADRVAENDERDEDSVAAVGRHIAASIRAMK